MTIFGSYLANATQVKFNSTVVTALISNTDAQIQVAVPGSLAAGAVNVSVVTPGGTSNTKTFTVVPAPVISDLKPNVSYKGFPIMILGSNLKGVISAKIGTTDATVLTLYDASMIISIPGSMTNGTYTVTVTNDGGPSNGVTLNIITAPAGVGSPPAANFVAPPPANYVNVVSNFWVGFGLLGIGSASQCQIVDPNDADNLTNYLCGSFQFAKDGGGNVIANFVEITKGTGNPATNLETFYGQWSSTVPDPCLQTLVLISAKDGHVVTATVDVSGFNLYGTPGICH